MIWGYMHSVFGGKDVVVGSQDPDLMRVIGIPFVELLVAKGAPLPERM